jgi:hypothetical protein
MNLTFSEIAPYLLIILVVIINVALFASLRSQSTRDQLDMLHKAGKTFQKPWEKDDRAMQELSQKVKLLHPDEEDIQNDDDE